MEAFEKLKTRWLEWGAIARILPYAHRIRAGAPWSFSRLLEERARKDGDHTGLLFEDRSYRWSEINAEVNRAARAFQKIGFQKGDTVAILMDNRPEFLFALTGLNRLRAAGALINTNILGSSLAHAIQISGCSAILVGQEHREKIEAILPELPGIDTDHVFVQGEAGALAGQGFRCFQALLNECPNTPPDGLTPPRVDDRFGYIYTSGTTGLPKAAIVTNLRVMSTGTMMGRIVFDMKKEDVVYITTPLYHSVAIYIGWSGTLVTGATLALRRRFSASNFWDDVRRYNVSVFVYIGELCRYLLNQPPHPLERDHRLRVAGGNGLRPDIWPEFQSRFSIPAIREYYGATEGNSAAVNLTGRPGMVGRLRQGAKLLRCDLETGELIRNASGFCEAVTEGEIGLFVGPISWLPGTQFDGYADQEASEKKLLHDVFKPGDTYFNSGDLLNLHEDGWISFADRVGDTFRWKGENVSTNEVAEILNGTPHVLETNVYGVEIPGTDGRAGMASVNCGPQFKLEDLARVVMQQMPSYQRPIFLRLQKEMQTTTTFKHQKVNYRREGYDPSKTQDPLYFLEGESYIPLDAEIFESLRNGSRKIR